MKWLSPYPISFWWELDFKMLTKASKEYRNGFLNSFNFNTHDLKMTTPLPNHYHTITTISLKSNQAKHVTRLMDDAYALHVINSKISNIVYLLIVVYLFQTQNSPPKPPLPFFPSPGIAPPLSIAAPASAAPPLPPNFFATYIPPATFAACVMFSCVKRPPRPPPRV